MAEAQDTSARRLDLLQFNLRELSRWASAEAVQVEVLETGLTQERARADQLASLLAAQAGSQRAPAPTAAPAPRQRGRAAVVSWDMGHNPAGRAMVLYDLLAAAGWETELVGPLWSRFGGRLWPPIARSDRTIRTFPCDRLEQFWPAALGLAATARYDLVVICKPRLPGILLGSLIAKAAKCPIILDVDDFELSFTDDETAVTLDALEAEAGAALAEPYGNLATRACESVIRDAPQIVVSNVALRARYGGILVRHARNEEAFNPARFDREGERRNLGIAAEDFALIFVGTPRRHKGVLRIAEVLDALPDKRFVLHLVGDITDKRDIRDLEAFRNARVVRHPGCDFDDLPRIISAADAVVLLQDPAHPISQYQIPAKISDAAAFGLPVITTAVPPTRDLAELGLVTVIDPEALGDTLTALMAGRDRFPGGCRPAVREAFETELGFAVNGPRLELAASRAAKAGAALPASFQRLLDIAEGAYRRHRAASRPARAPAVAAASDGHDLVMFWKQNDSGIYGRRPDMLMKHFLDSGRVRRVLQFDAPLEMADLTRLSAASNGADSASLLSLANVIDDQSHLRDTDRHRHRSYLWARGKPAHPLFPGAGASLAEYPAYVAAQIEAAGIDPARAIAWVCPVVFDFPAIAAALPFRARIGDLIDDQRAFEMSPAYRRRIEDSYEQTLPLLDLAFTNCDPLREAFAHFVRDIRVVPNGTELPGPLPDAPAPELAGLRRPVIGYVGNLRDRIDWSLLQACALQMPEASFVVVGGGARPEDIERIRQVPNVTFTGVVPYARVMEVIAGFDVAIMPHLRTEQTGRMNPLKIYNYFAARRPIVTTPVANIDQDLTPFLRFGEDAPGFVRAIRESLREPLVQLLGYEAALDGITWPRRVAGILDALDRWLRDHGR